MVKNEKLLKQLQERVPNVDVLPFLNEFKEVIQIKKNDFLVKPGDKAFFLAYINKGAFRVFFLDETGREITTWFGFEEMWVTDLMAYYKNTIANFYVQAIENSEVYIITKKSLNKLYKQYPKYKDFAIGFAEEGMVMMMERCYYLQALPAKERYLKLMTTQIINRVPSKYIATFLGITETSLSRLRRQIFVK